LIYTSTGNHDELVKDPQGAYSQLIRLQETHQEDYQLQAPISHSRSTRSLPLQRSTSNPAECISRHTTLTASLIGPDESTKHNDTNIEKKNENNEGKSIKKAPVQCLLTLNKQEMSLLVFGSLAAAIHGALIPMTGFLLATAAKIFYEPLDKRGKDSRFWSLVCVGIGMISMVSRLVNCFLFGIAGGKLIERIRALAFQSIVHQEIAWFDDSANSRSVINTLYNGLSNILTDYNLLFSSPAGEHLVEDFALMPLICDV
jgi:ATP-binding cassette, subfamily B (MDR/TAP), member 1